MTWMEIESSNETTQKNTHNTCVHGFMYETSDFFYSVMVDFLIGHYTYRIFPPAIDIIPTLPVVVYSNGKYTN